LILQLPPSLYERSGRNAKVFGNGDEIRLKGLQEPEHRGKQLWVARLALQFIRPDSGQVEEPLRPTFVAERCR